MRCEGPELCFGRVIGKALEPLPAETGVIKILVSLNWRTPSATYTAAPGALYSKPTFDC